MSKSCSRCARGVHGISKKQTNRTNRKRGVHGIGKITENDVKDLGYHFLVNTGIFFASRAMFNPMFATIFKTQLGVKAKWVKYVPGIAKTLGGFFWWTHADGNVSKMASTALFSLGIQETLAATNNDLFGTPGVNLFGLLPKDEITPLLYGQPAISGYEDEIHGAPMLYLEEGMHGLEGLEDLDQLERIAGNENEESSAVALLAGLF